MADPDFRADLFRGTARSYDAHRPLYPRDLIDDLAARSGTDGTGRLLDLACGTGQVAFALRDRFAEVWAVDQEPDMIELASLKSAAAGHGPPLVLRTCAAEELAAPDEAFDLVTIGNAFHRLRRQVADRVLRWLRPGGYLALLWGGSPVEGGAPWQQTLQATMQSWHDRNGVAHRAPARIPGGPRRDARPGDPACGRVRGHRTFRVRLLTRLDAGGDRRLPRLDLGVVRRVARRCRATVRRGSAP